MLRRACDSAVLGSLPLVLATAARLATEALVHRPALEQLTAAPVLAHREPLRIEVGVGVVEVSGFAGGVVDHEVTGGGESSTSCAAATSSTAMPTESNTVVAVCHSAFGAASASPISAVTVAPDPRTLPA